MLAYIAYMDPMGMYPIIIDHPCLQTKPKHQHQPAHHLTLGACWPPPQHLIFPNADSAHVWLSARRDFF